MNLDDRCGSHRRLVRTFAVLMVGAALGATRGREILSLPAGGRDSCAVMAGAGLPASFVLEGLRAHYAAFPSAAGRTSPSEEVRQASLSEALDQAEKAEQEGRLDVALKKCQQGLDARPQVQEKSFMASKSDSVSRRKCLLTIASS